MMSRLKLNYYRAEDEMLIMERIRWRKEEEERKKERKKAEKELAKIRTQKNKEWREKREEEKKKQEEWLEDEQNSDYGVEEALRSELKCPVCSVWMMPPAPIFQCEDGHVICSHCRHLPYMEECPDCMGPFVGRNTLIENIAAIVFSKDVAVESSPCSVIWEEE